MKISEESLVVIEANECLADSLAGQRFRALFAEIRRLTYHIRRVCPCGLCNGKGYTTDERSCVRCGGKGWNENESSRAAPEWRPLAVLTHEVAKRWTTWAFRAEGCEVPINRDLRVAVLIPGEWREALRWIITHDNGRLVAAWFCRPIDAEGVLIPWVEVGL